MLLYRQAQQHKHWTATQTKQTSAKNKASMLAHDTRLKKLQCTRDTLGPPSLHSRSVCKMRATVQEFPQGHKHALSHLIQLLLNPTLPLCIYVTCACIFRNIHRLPTFTRRREVCHGRGGDGYDIVSTWLTVDEIEIATFPKFLD